MDLVVSILRNGIAYFYLIYVTLQNGLSASEFLLYFTAVSGFSSMISATLSKFSDFHKQSIEISRIREFLDYKEDFKFENGISLEPNLDKAYTIELRNVSFKYQGAKDYTLKNINLTLHNGENLAVVGLNGAGKTTLIKVICGLFDPTEGEVLLNGQNIKQYNREDYYRHFSAVFQEVSFLEISIATNIAGSETEIDREKVIDCLEKANMMDKIKTLRRGINTPYGKYIYLDGELFSGGEVQKLMLARALYKNAPIMLLDEPTAALDPLAESAMYERYNELTAGKSSIYISHRLASTRFCDRIILLEGNVLKEQGTHEELVKLGGSYANLYEVQSRYYREGAEF